MQSHKISPERRGFLDLPRELRDLVYEHVFVVSGAIFVYSRDSFIVPHNARASVVRNGDEGPLEPRRVPEIIPIAFMRVCRQVHAECIGFLYSLNIFRLYTSNADFAPRYRSLVRQVVFTTDAINQKVFSQDLSVMEYCWRRYFWPEVIVKSIKVLQTFSNLDTLIFPIQSSGASWKPAFISSLQKSRVERVALAAGWLQSRCPIADERLRDCLQLEVIRKPSIAKELYEGSRFFFEEEWDPTEFAEAFNLMKVYGQQQMAVRVRTRS